MKRPRSSHFAQTLLGALLRAGKRAVVQYRLDRLADCHVTKNQDVVVTGRAVTKPIGFRRNTPCPKPPLLLNDIPARSRAFRIALIGSSYTCPRSFSKSTTVERPRSALCARFGVRDIQHKAQAALHVQASSSSAKARCRQTQLLPSAPW